MSNLRRARRTWCVRARTWLVLGVALAAGCRDANGPQTGTVQVALRVSGVDLPTSGSVIFVIDGATRRAFLGANSTVTVGGLTPGPHTVLLTGLGPNCTADGGVERALTVSASAEARASFDVTCMPLVGSLRITTVTRGDEPDPDGYTVALRGGKPQPIGANASVTLTGLRVGTFAVTVADLAVNCSLVAPATPGALQAVVAYGSTTELTVAVDCVKTGTLRVVSTTSGPDEDPDGYVLRAENGVVGTSIPMSAGAAAATLELPPGDFRLTLSGVAENCERAGPATRLVTVSEGATTDVEFTVACAPVTRLAFVSERDGNAEIYAVNANGTGLTRLTDNLTPEAGPAWSPDGRRIAFASDRGSTSDIYVMNADGSDVRRLTDGPGRNLDPAWSPDGTRIAFASDRAGVFNVFTMDAGGANQARLTSDASTLAEYAPAWSPDGRRIAFTTEHSGGRDIYVADVATGNVLPMTNSATRSRWLGYGFPAWSPDGTHLAVVRSDCSSSNCYYLYYYGESLASEVAQSIQVLNTDGTAAPYPILDAVTGATSARPAWSPDGRALVFTATDCSGDPCAQSLVYVRLNGGGNAAPLELIARGGHAPAWRR